MHYLPLVILLVIVGVLSILIDRRRTRQVAAAEQQEAPTNDPARDPAATTPMGVFTRLTKQWSQRFGRKPPPLPDDPVRAWLTHVFVEEPAERRWFASLTPAQFTLLRRELTNFCTELGFDLPWLVEQSSFKPATLEQTGKTIVTHYCRAVRAAVLVHDEMKAVQRYQAFLATPATKENLVFGEQLYTHLVDEKLAPAATPELLMAGEKERQHFMVEAIQRAAQQAEARFSAILKMVALGKPSPTPTATVPTSSVSYNGAPVGNPVVA